MYILQTLIMQNNVTSQGSHRLKNILEMCPKWGFVENYKTDQECNCKGRIREVKGIFFSLKGEGDIFHGIPIPKTFIFYSTKPFHDN